MRSIFVIVSARQHLTQRLFVHFSVCRTAYTTRIILCNSGNGAMSYIQRATLERIVHRYPIEPSAEGFRWPPLLRGQRRPQSPRTTIEWEFFAYRLRIQPTPLQLHHIADQQHPAFNNRCCPSIAVQPRSACQGNPWCRFQTCLVV